ncbi:MAG: leucine-rich repeat domain-containing protein [Clostridiales bacterium]|nr:leucine-rich repeat domain-containing protein [Clostridiales bacterium]
MFNVRKGVLVSIEGPMSEYLMEVPENVDTIGTEALKGIKCRVVRLPSTLKLIMKSAFEDACVNQIDFKSCSKLEEIGKRAFYGCNAKAKLPDCVAIIGEKGVNGLKLMDGDVLKLPRSLKHIGNEAFAVKKNAHVYAENSSLANGSNTVRSIIASIASPVYGLEFYLHVLEGGVEAYSVLICTSGNHLHQAIMKDFIEGEKGFQLELYDKSLRCINEYLPRIEAVNYRLKNPQRLSALNQEIIQDIV